MHGVISDSKMSLGMHSFYLVPACIGWRSPRLKLGCDFICAATARVAGEQYEPYSRSFCHAPAWIRKLDGSIIRLGRLLIEAEVVCRGQPARFLIGVHGIVRRCPRLRRNATSEKDEPLEVIDEIGKADLRVRPGQADAADEQVHPVFCSAKTCSMRERICDLAL
jgi:hypothetical protein